MKRKKNIKEKFKRNRQSSREHVQKLVDITEARIQGRRIVDFNYFWRELSFNLQDHGKSCRLKDWQFIKESNFHGRLRTLFCFQCRKCKKECKIWSKPEIGDLNQASVLGTLAEGLGYSQTQGLLACMDIPYITDRSFKTHQETLLFHLNRISASVMKEAGEQEYRLAMEAGDVHENGTPFITVILDGSWVKRSFGTKYDSLSGLGAIIGKRTGKV